MRRRKVSDIKKSKIKGLDKRCQWRGKGSGQGRVILRCSPLDDRLCWRGKARKSNIEGLEDRLCWRGQGKGGWMIGCVRGGKARKSNIEGVDERLCWRGQGKEE